MKKITAKIEAAAKIGKVNGIPVDEKTFSLVLYAHGLSQSIAKNERFLHKYQHETVGLMLDGKDVTKRDKLAKEMLADIKTDKKDLYAISDRIPVIYKVITGRNLYTKPSRGYESINFLAS